MFYPYKGSWSDYLNPNQHRVDVPVKNRNTFNSRYFWCNWQAKLKDDSGVCSTANFNKLCWRGVQQLHYLNLLLFLPPYYVHVKMWYKLTRHTASHFWRIYPSNYAISLLHDPLKLQMTWLIILHFYQSWLDNFVVPYMIKPYSPIILPMHPSRHYYFINCSTFYDCPIWFLLGNDVMHYLRHCALTIGGKLICNWRHLIDKVKLNSNFVKLTYQLLLLYLLNSFGEIFQSLDELSPEINRCVMRTKS